MNVPHATALSVTLLLTAIVSTHADTPPTVTVVGTRETPSEFTWRITNNGSKPITSFQVTHSGGRKVTPPPGWIAKHLNQAVEENQLFRPGTIRYETDLTTNAIHKGQTKVFTLWDPNRGGKVLKKTVVIGFNDGSELTVTGVDCPSTEPFLGQNLPLIGLGTIFLVFLICRSVKGGKKSTTDSASNSD